MSKQSLIEQHDHTIPMPDEKKASRGTIFSEAGINDIQATYGEKAAENLSKAGGVMFQAVLFFSCIFLGGLQPIFAEYSLKDEFGNKTADYSPQSFYIVSFTLCIVICNVICCTFKPRTVSTCWNVKAIVYMFPVALTYGVAKVLELYSLKFIDAPLSRIIQQVKLPLTALLAGLILGAKTSFLSWTQIGAASFAILGYNVASSKNPNLSFSLYGVNITLLIVLLGVLGSLFAEAALKKPDFGFFAQMCQLRVGVLIVCFMLYGYGLYSGNITKGFFHGWNRYVVISALWTVLKDILATYLIKRLDTIWKSLASALSLGVTYITSCLLNKSTDPVLVFFIIILLIHVVTYGLSKRVSKEFDELKKQAAAASEDERKPLLK